MGCYNRHNFVKGYDNMDNDKNPVQSADRIFQVIDVLTERGPCGLLEISAMLSLNKSTVHRLLNSLIYMGYVKQNEETLKYQMTLKVVTIAGKVLKQIDILSIVQPYMRFLMEQACETVHLVKRVDNRITYINKLEPSYEGRSIRMASFIGMVSPLYCTAVGKAIMSELSEDEVRGIWESSLPERKTEYTILEMEQLLKELAAIRKLGYAMDNEENEVGVRCIAASIKDYSSTANYAISISAPTGRMSDERVQELIPLLISTCLKLSHELGYKAQ